MRGNITITKCLSIVSTILCDYLFILFYCSVAQILLEIVDAITQVSSLNFAPSKTQLVCFRGPVYIHSLFKCIKKSLTLFLYVKQIFHESYQSTNLHSVSGISKKHCITRERNPPFFLTVLSTLTYFCLSIFLVGQRSTIHKCHDPFQYS